MKLPKRQREEEAPQGVRIHCPGGQVIECDMLRDPDGDEDGCAHWIAVPRQPLPVLALGDEEGFGLSVDMHPGKTSIGVSLTAQESLP